MTLDPLAPRDLDTSNQAAGLASKDKSRGASYKIQQAGEILRPTRQYLKWLDLCQSNDVDANALADLILERHQLVRSANHGDAVDWEHFDRLTREIGASGIWLYESKNFSNSTGIKHQEPALTEEGLLAGNSSSVSRVVVYSQSLDAQTQNTSDSIFQDDNLLLLDMVYDKQSMGGGLTAYWDENKLMLPLGELCRNLDLSIQVLPENGTAKGWFLSEDRVFDLSLPNSETFVDGKKMQLLPENARVYNDEIYVDSGVFSYWFPVDFNLNFSDQTLEMSTREKFPFESRIEREKAKGNMGAKSSDDPVLPRLETPYKILGAPVVDTGFTAYIKSDHRDTPSTSSVYYLSSRGDLAGMNSELYLSGTGEDGLDTFRGRLEKNDPDGEMLGFLKARHIALGDVDVADFPVISNGDRERGVAINNTSLYRKSEFDTTVFNGDALPGWDVEVYRNNMLIGSQTVGASGQYEFEDVQLYYGNNEFEIVLYGPHGEEKHEKRNIQVGTNMLEKGASEYQASLSQKESLVFDPNDTSDTTDEGSLRFVGNYKYGLTEHTSLSLGMGTQQIDDEKHRFLNAGAMSSVKGVYLTGNYVHDMDGGDAFQMIGQTSVGPLNINLKQEFFNDFVDEDQASVSSVRVYGNIDPDGKLLPTIPFSMVYNTEDSGFKALNVGLAGKMKNINYNTNLTWQESGSNTDDDDTSTLGGAFNFITQFEDYKLRGKIGYDFLPRFDISQLQLVNTYNISDDLSSELTLEKDIAEDNYEGSLRLNWKNDHFTLSPEISLDTDNEFRAMLSFNTTFGENPASGKIRFDTDMSPGKGGLSARVYNDKNHNSVYDREDEPIQGAVVKLPQVHKEEQTDENGIAFIPDLQKYRATDVFVKADSLGDPSLQPVKKGNSVVPRPGKIQVMDIPVVATGEIDGTVFSQTSSGADKPMGNVPVQLLDEQGRLVQETRSEFDGFYLFEKVLPGNYKVAIDDDVQTALGASGPNSDMVSIEDDGGMVSEVDFHLKKPSVSVARADLSAPANIPGNDQSGLPLSSQNSMNHEKAGKDEGAKKINNVASVQTPARAAQVPDVRENRDQGSGERVYGIHLSSYKNQDQAVAAVNTLSRKYSNLLSDASFVIRQVDLKDEKGTFYRVIAGAGSTADNAERLKQKIEQTGSYAKVMSFKKNGHFVHGVHLSSFKTAQTAQKGIQVLKNRYPDSLSNISFNVRSAHINKGKGDWERVIAGEYTDKKDARNLAESIRKKHPYAALTTTGHTKDKAIHLASYRTLKSATQGLMDMVHAHKNSLNNQELMIKKVDLGEDKGTWYRLLAGRVDSDDSLQTLRKTILKENQHQYARILGINR